MPYAPYTSADVAGRMLLLGTGTSVGVPMIGCGCRVCTGGHPRNQRTRTSAVLGLPEGVLLIDTSPDLRMQLLRERIGLVHAVLYTHEHTDHIVGLDDLRLMQFHLGGPVPLYCEAKVEERIRKSFDYAFADIPNLHAGATPKLDPRRIGLEPFAALGAWVIPLRMRHGPNFTTLGFRFGDVAYCTDVNGLPPDSLDKLRGLDTLVLGALRYERHATHYSIDEALAVVAELRPKRTYFTHLSHELDYDRVQDELPDDVELAYDGLSIPLTGPLSGPLAGGV